MLEIILLISTAVLLGITLYNVLLWPKLTTRPMAVQQDVSVLIPARNEESNLAACLDAVLQQPAGLLEVLVYDDHSTDVTPEILTEFVGRDGRVRAVQPKPLPDGWCGKNFACAQLAGAARGSWLLFLDADARLTQGAIARMVTEAVHRNATFLSCWPRLQMVGFWERVLMPLLNFVVFTIYPAPLSLARSDASLGLAHGACLLIERATYEKLGGHAAVRGEIFEDTRLAKLWRERGERSLCLDGSGEVSVRMYGSLAEIWLGFQKNFFPAFRRETGFWGFLLLHSVMFLSPFLLAVWSPNWQTVAAAFCVVLMRASLALRFRHPLWSVVLHPLAETLLLLLALSSWWRCKSGRGVVWKERTYRSTQ